MVDRAIYDEQVDVWGLGILLFELIHGYSPFKGASNQDVCQNIKKNQIVFQSNVTQEARDLIVQILRPAAGERIKIEDILRHPFVCGTAIMPPPPPVVIAPPQMRYISCSPSKKRTFTSPPARPPPGQHRPTPSIAEKNAEWQRNQQMVSMSINSRVDESQNTRLPSSNSLMDPSLQAGDSRNESRPPPRVLTQTSTNIPPRHPSTAPTVNRPPLAPANNVIINAAPKPVQNPLTSVPSQAQLFNQVSPRVEPVKVVSSNRDHYSVKLPPKAPVDHSTNTSSHFYSSRAGIVVPVQQAPPESVPVMVAQMPQQSTQQPTLLGTPIMAPKYPHGQSRIARENEPYPVYERGRQYGLSNPREASVGAQGTSQNRVRIVEGVRNQSPAPLVPINTHLVYTPEKHQPFFDPNNAEHAAQVRVTPTTASHCRVVRSNSTRALQSPQYVIRSPNMGGVMQHYQIVNPGLERAPPTMIEQMRNVQPPTAQSGNFAHPATEAYQLNPGFFPRQDLSSHGMRQPNCSTPSLLKQYQVIM